MTSTYRLFRYAPTSQEQAEPLQGDDIATQYVAAGHVFAYEDLELDREHLAHKREAIRAEHRSTGRYCLALIPTEFLRQPRLLVVTDVDSTLIQEEVIELLAEYAGKQEQVRAVTESAMRGELDFAQSLRARLTHLEGLPETVMNAVHGSIHLSPGAVELVERTHARGGVIGAVSGGFDRVLIPLAKELGLDHALANTLNVSQGQLTGDVDGAIVDAARKAQALQEWAAEHGIPGAATVAVGDGANDLVMMAKAGLSVAYRGKPAVVAAADVALDRLDILAALLYGPA